MCGRYHNFRFSEREFLASGRDNQHQIEFATEIGFQGQAISRRRGPDERDESVRIDQTDLPDAGANQPACGGLASAGDLTLFTPSFELRDYRDADVRRR
jgi:hypothetical protein